MQMAGTKASDSKQTSVAKFDNWARLLPTPLLLQTMSWLCDTQSVSRMQAVCRSWSSVPSEKLDLVWRSIYLREWEPESATDSCIAVKGESTPWRQRFKQRLLLKRRWHEGKFIRRNLFKHVYSVRWVQFADNHLVVASGTDIATSDFHTGKLIHRWSTART